jgi:hypothetical protein
MPRWPGPSTYDPLTRYLAGLAADEVMLTFAEIEQLVGAPLPRSAWRSGYWTRAMRPWGPQNRPWTRAGWRVVRVHLQFDRPTVTFQRTPR